MSVKVMILLTLPILVISCQQQAETEEPAAAPLPDAAAGPAIPQDKGYLVEEIQDGLYWVTEGVYQTIFLTTGEGVIVVDAPPSIGENLFTSSTATPTQTTSELQASFPPTLLSLPTRRQRFS